MKVQLPVLVFATLAFSAFAFAQNNNNNYSLDTAYQVKYASNLNIGDSVINITNDGSYNVSNSPASLCANVYTFAPDEQLIACCSCLVTPDGLNSISAQADLISNTLTGVVPTSIVVKIFSSKPNTGSTGAPSCSPSTVSYSSLEPGIKAWGTTLHAAPTTPVSYQVTETPFTMGNLSNGEFISDVTECAYIGVLGSGSGICKSCATGGLGAAKE